MPITDVDRIKRALRIPAGITVADARITEIAGEVDAELLAEIGLDSWDAATVYNDSLDVDSGGIGQTVLLRHYPVTSMVAVTASGVGLTQDVDYRVDRGGVIRLLSTAVAFDVGRGTVHASYTAGHVAAGSTPAWLARLGTLAACRQFNYEPQAGIGDMTVDPIKKAIADFDHDAADREIQRALSRWRLR